MTEETTEVLYDLDESHRIVGISGFTVRPPRARKEKPKVSAFTSAKIDRILELAPDLVLGFSDIQADIAAELVRNGVTVKIFNQRSVKGIFQMIRVLGGMIGCEAKAQDYARRLEAGLERLATRELPARPRIYFEEWDEPMISGIRWVSELIEVAGGEDCFAELGAESLAKNRIIADPDTVVAANPDIIVGSWCGKKFRPERVAERHGWENIAAVRRGHVYEVKSALILQPGPAALTEGVAELAAIVDRWVADTHATAVSRENAS
ncbi:MAG: ABC transporter substrate-binding protein [Pseudomonadota bacterium]